MGGYNLPPSPGWDRINVSENLGKEAALPALPLIMLLKYIDLLLVMKEPALGIQVK